MDRSHDWCEFVVLGDQSIGGEFMIHQESVMTHQYIAVNSGTEAVTTLFDTVEEHTESAMAIVLGLIGLLLLLSLSLFVVRR